MGSNIRGSWDFLSRLLNKRNNWGALQNFTDGIRVGGTTSYLEVESNGFAEAFEDAGGWDDLRVPLTTGKIAGANLPVFDTFKNGVNAYKFSDTNEIWFSTQMPHTWEEGTTVYPHLHWAPSTDVAQNKNVGIGFEYTVASINDTFGTTSSVTRMVETGTTTAFKHFRDDFSVTGIDMTGHTISAMLICRFYRFAATSDNYADDIFGLEVDFHYKKNTNGSREILTK